MSLDALDRACEAWRIGYIGYTPVGSFDEQPELLKREQRNGVAAALRVMADAIRAEVRADHLPCGECDLASRVSDILDTYTENNG